jgi:hypothetical protein
VRICESCSRSLAYEDEEANGILPVYPVGPLVNNLPDSVSAMHNVRVFGADPRRIGLLGRRHEIPGSHFRIPRKCKVV